VKTDAPRLPHTIVAFLNESDRRRFLEETSHFPRSTVAQLPPHVTVLGQVFLTRPAGEVARKLTVELPSAHPLELDTGTGATWLNMRDGGHIIAVKVHPTPALRQIRLALQRILLGCTVSEQEAVWFDYDPHVTVSLNATETSVLNGAGREFALSMHLQLRELELLAPGGEFFGYSRIARLPLDRAAREIKQTQAP
jgi:hypothetical protein